MKKPIELEDLEKNLRILHDYLRSDVHKKWKRVIPFDEMLFDRWEKANYLRAKSGASIYHNSYIFGNVSIGKKTWIGPFTIIDGSGGKIKIGSYCSISTGVQIYTHHTIKWSLTGGKHDYEKANVIIGDRCYLGPNVIVSKGIRIGKCSLIGANSLINKSIPPYSIAFGSPCKIVGNVKIRGKTVEYCYDKK